MNNKWVNPEKQKIESETTDRPVEWIDVLEQVGKKRFVPASQDSNRWVNPPKQIKSENEFPAQEPVIFPFGHYTRQYPSPSFDKIKKQVGKKSPKKKKRDKVVELSLLLSDE